MSVLSDIKSHLQYYQDELTNEICFKEIYKKDKKEIKKDKVLAFLTDRFELQKYGDFPAKFEQAVGGDGDEAKKMVSIRSSSLCALLFFFNISKHNPLSIDGEKYAEAYFEVKNQVYSKPSNMDVVLVSEDGKKILFIECKFSEYLEKTRVRISDAYRNNALSGKIYEEAMDEGIFKQDNTVADPGYTYYIADQYMGGLKQIISHYVGLTNFMKRQKGQYMKNERRDIYDRDYEEVSFMEVLFDFKNAFKDELEAYKGESNKLIKVLERNSYGINYLESSTYQTILAENPGYSIPDKVKEFYNYNQTK